LGCVSRGKISPVTATSKYTDFKEFVKEKVLIGSKIISSNYTNSYDYLSGNYSDLKNKKSRGVQNLGTIPKIAQSRL
jgi:hypothetical protein